MKTVKLNTPLTEKAISGISAGDKILLNGDIFVARDQAHLMLNKMLNENLSLPIKLDNQIIYYAGPSPARPGETIGSIGPTTSARMDKLTETLLKNGLSITIGKGERSKEIREMVIKYKAPYLVAMGGAGAVIHNSVMSSKIVAFEEMGPEAIFKLKVKNMPLYVAYDIYGGSIYHGEN